MKKEQRNKALAAFFASAFLHQKRILIGGRDSPPTPTESYHAYTTDPIIAKLTDAAVIGVQEIYNIK